MVLVAIVVATLVAGIGSVWLAAWLARGVFARHATGLLSLAAGALLATALMHLLPEAFESGLGPHELFATLLVGLVFFFLLDKAELWHHGHEHHHGPHAHEAHEAHETHGSHEPPARPAQGHGTAAHAPAPAAHRHTGPAHQDGHAQAHSHAHGHAAGGWAVLLGDSVHAFGDGILIAAAFMADLRLGAAAALAVLAHEVPHHIGDLVVLRQGSRDARSALLKVSLAGAITALGGVLGYLLVGQWRAQLPYFLVVASSSFIYVALADLIPQLQKRLDARQTTAQVAWLALGMGLVMVLSGLVHTHGAAAHG